VHTQKRHLNVLISYENVLRPKEKTFPLFVLVYATATKLCDR